MMCMLGVFLARIAYLSAFMSASSLIAMAKYGATSLLLYHISDFTSMCTYMMSKGEFFGVSGFSGPSKLMTMWSLPSCGFSTISSPVLRQYSLLSILLSLVQLDYLII